MTAKITLTWDNGSSEHVDQIVYRSTQTFTVGNLPPILARVGRSAREYIDTDIVTGNVYFYAVASENAVGDILLSSVISVTAEVSTGDPHWDNVVSLLHFDGDLIDETGRVWANSGSSFETVNPMMGSGSLKLATLGEHISTAGTSDLNLGDGDFTIELFYRVTSSGPAEHAIISQRESYVSTQAFSLWQNKLLGFDGQIITGSTPLTGSVPKTLVVGQKYHLALVRLGEKIYLFIDGNKHEFVDIGTGSVKSVAAPLMIGRLDTVTNIAKGLGDFDEFRITKGVARYTANFTPPTEPFPNF